MPVIQVDMFVGRSVEQKRALVHALTDAFVQSTGAKPESVQIILRDVDKQDWGVAGELCSDRAAAQAGAAVKTD